jgi:hypothetical protein
MKRPAGLSNPADLAQLNEPARHNRVTLAQDLRITASPHQVR